MNMSSKSSNLLVFIVLMGALLLPGCAKEKRIVRMVNGKQVVLHRTSYVEEFDTNKPLGAVQGAGALWSAAAAWNFGIASLLCFAHGPKEAWPILIPVGIVCGCCSAGFIWLTSKLGKDSYENCTGERVVDEYMQEAPATVGVINEFEIEQNNN